MIYKFPPTDYLESKLLELFLDEQKEAPDILKILSEQVSRGCF